MLISVPYSFITSFCHCVLFINKQNDDDNDDDDSSPRCSAISLVSQIQRRQNNPLRDRQLATPLVSCDRFTCAHLLMSYYLSDQRAGEGKGPRSLQSEVCRHCLVPQTKFLLNAIGHLGRKFSDYMLVLCQKLHT